MKLEVTDIPAMPQIVLQVIRFDPMDPKASSDALEKIISPDKGMTASIMRVANSVYYGQSGKVKILKDAVTLLGLKATKNLVLLLTGGEMFGRLKSESFRLLIHEMSILTALVGLDISKPLGVPALRDECFLYGLLHNIGMSVIALNATKEYEQLLSGFMNQKGSLVELEEKHLETNHKKIGIQVFEKWKMPEEGSGIIAKYDFSPDQVQDQTDLTKIISISANIVRRMLALPEFPDAQQREQAVLESFGKDSKVSAGFGGEYYGLIQEHPFYELAMEI